MLLKVTTALLTFPKLCYSNWKLDTIVVTYFFSVITLNIAFCFLFRQTIKTFKRQFHKMVKRTQTIRRQFADELFDCVWPFCGIGA